MQNRFVSPTERGQVTIPKEIRQKLRITPTTKLRVYVENNKVVLEPVTSLEVLLKDLVAEAKDKGYTRREIEQEIEAVRERLFRELYGDQA
ncbi:AbrB family looped-hinge helix DNA binding protein [Thermodesulfitimonas autotrophica]|uniref:AbrB family looped-hinge helix DNA binding protein n=1 Tax=Thermodesulfitimonas autotrophica TaxID=1894989 RepID=A0A3N5BEU5_9THEO|nr:AbrB/MazE/SpoVT family DNA-binding domain-containing protein [Thermodesulfitimonas autotrophica]RPF46622.1 AbrB family looped-hinge helix DNA binding protein [Thermodesulfitimonas autotrophica]